MRRALPLLLFAALGVGALANPSSAHSTPANDSGRPRAHDPSVASASSASEPTELAQARVIPCDPTVLNDEATAQDNDTRCEIEVAPGERGNRRETVTILRATDGGGLVFLRVGLIETPRATPGARKFQAALIGLPERSMGLAERLLWPRRFSA
ncbi:MAG: hypothetical protein ACYC8V_11600 [Caulobacteraceae bacterium]